MMKNKLTSLVVIALVIVVSVNSSRAKNDDFRAVITAIEQFYGVKHQTIPFLARAGMKAATTAARVRGGQYKRLAEAGSVRIVFFPDQDFDSHGSITSFKTALLAAVSPNWSPLVQTLAPKEEEQTYIFIRNAGEKVNVLVVSLARREGTVVQVNLNPGTLAQLMQNPEDMGKAITDDAAQDDN